MALHIAKNGTILLKKYFERRALSYINNLPYYNNDISKRRLHLSSCLEKVVSFNLSDIGEGIREVTVKEWFVQVGDTVEQFDNLCEVQSDKASVTITSRYDGKIVKIHCKQDDIALVGKPLLDFDVEDENEGESESYSSDSSSASSSSAESMKSQELKTKQKEWLEEENSQDRTRIMTTPAVRRIAMENKVDLSKVVPTGRQGRVLKGDVLEYLGQIPQGTQKPHATLLAKVTKKAAAAPADRTETLKGVRKVMFKAMSESLKIPHFAYSDEIDMTKLIEFRDQLKSGAADRGVPKLTFMPFCIKAASLALSRYPILNSSVCTETESVIYKGAHNISVAMDTPQGLVVPNVKNCQNKSIIEIAKDLNDLMARGRAGSLSPQDFADGTFSLSNIGIIGGTYTHPCIMTPQVSIGAMGRTKVVPRFGPNGDIVKAHIMNVSWSADHRVIDGVTMASFSNVWKNYLENPALFLLANDE